MKKIEFGWASWQRNLRLVTKYLGAAHCWLHSVIFVRFSWNVTWCTALKVLLYSLTCIWSYFSVEGIWYLSFWSKFVLELDIGAWRNSVLKSFSRIPAVNCCASTIFILVSVRCESLFHCLLLKHRFILLSNCFQVVKSKKEIRQIWRVSAWCRKKLNVVLLI